MGEPLSDLTGSHSSPLEPAIVKLTKNYCHLHSIDKGKYIYIQNEHVVRNT